MSDQIRENLETGKQRSIVWREWGYTALIWSGVMATLVFIIGIIIFLCYAVPALKEAREASRATAKGWSDIVDSAGAQIPLTIEKTNRILDSVDRLIRNGGTLVSSGQVTLSKLNSTLDAGAVTIEKGGTAIEGIGHESQSMIARTNDRLNSDGGLLPEITTTVHSVNLLTQNELRDAVAQIALAGKNLVVITSAPELQELPGEIARLASSLNVSAGNVTVVTEQFAGVAANFNRMSDDSRIKVHSLLNPAPAPFWKKYILYPLKDIGGVAYLLVKIANGL